MPLAAPKHIEIPSLTQQEGADSTGMSLPVAREGKSGSMYLMDRGKNSHMYVLLYYSLIVKQTYSFQLLKVFKSVFNV